MKHLKLFESFVNESNHWKLVISNPDDNKWVVKALKSGKEIGRLDFIESRFKPVLKATIVTVDPAHRRQGVGSSMYVFAEAELGKKFVRSEDVLTPDGKRIWSSGKFGI